MVIILCLYVVALWLVFSKFKLVRWGWLSGTVAIVIGAFILATFLALFNYLTPSGRVTVTGRVVEVTPNVTGQIVAIPVKPNVPVKTNDVLFQIDPAPFQYKVSQLQASLAGAKQQVEILKTNYEQATANVTGLVAQQAFNKKRLADIQTLVADDANTQFQAQDRQNQYETVTAQLEVAKASQQSAKLALDSEIGGVNTTVAQIAAQLDNANWELSQTTIRAPADGTVTIVALSVGDRALQAARRCRSLSRRKSRWSGFFRRTVFKPSSRARPSTSSSTTFRAASITRPSAQFPEASARDRSRCRERLPAPIVSEVRRFSRPRFPFRTR
jgi:multidrug resistance efflux pump